jgi:hypothetical protein
MSSSYRPKTIVFRSPSFCLLFVATMAISAICPLCGAILIDDFERANAPAPWTFSNGAEFPGATGSLTSGIGHSGKGAHLAFNLSRGGHYVSANLTLPSPLSVAAIGFWVKSPPNITVVLRVVDATGQTLQYNLRRPLDHLDAASWYQQVVALGIANGWYGGVDDSQLHEPVHALSILAADPLVPGAVGAIDFDDVTALTSNVFNLDPALQPLMPAPSGASDLLSRLGVNIHFTSDNRALDAAQAVGLTWVRMDLVWRSIEISPSHYNWSAYDGLIEALQSRSMKALRRRHGTLLALAYDSKCGTNQTSLSFGLRSPVLHSTPPCPEKGSNGCISETPTRWS